MRGLEGTLLRTKDTMHLVIGVELLQRSIAVEVASRNITVNAIAPGFIETPMTDVLSQELKDKMKAMIPLGRFGQDHEIAAAIVFLASDEAGYNAALTP